MRIQSIVITLPLEMAVVESCNKVNGSQLIMDSVDKNQPVNDKIEAIQEDEDYKTMNNEPITNNQSPDIAKIQAKWTYILETVRAYNFSLEALLRSAKLVACEGSSVLFEVPYSFHQRILESTKSRELLESVFSDVLERRIKIATALGKRPVIREELANVEIASDDEIVKIASEIFNSEAVN